MDDVAKVWAVSGLRTQVFASKADAEAAARQEFPSDAPGKRYARIYYLTLWATRTSAQELANRLAGTT